MSHLRGKQHFRRIIWAALAVLVVVCMGTLAFVFFEGWSVLDGLYMTLITLSTVGYAEVRPLDGAGRIIAMAVIVFGIGIVFQVFRILLVVGMEGAFRNVIFQRRVKRMIKSLNHHVIVCGYGRVGRTVAAELKRYGRIVVVIDQSEELVAEAEEDGHIALRGDATEEEPLREGGILRARALYAIVESDAKNVFIALTAHELNPHLTILARAVAPNAERKLRRAGASYVISPSQIGGRRLALSLVHPTLVNLMDIAAGSEPENDLTIEEVQVPQACPQIGKTIKDLALRNRFELLLVAVTRPTQKTFFNPSPDYTLEAGDRLLCMAPREGFRSFCALLEERVGEPR